MKSNNKRKTGKKTPAKKSFFSSVQFLIIVFSCIFIFLGTVTINALAVPAKASSNNSGSGSESYYTSFFDFKTGNGQTLTMILGAKAATDLLIIDTEKAITGFLITAADGTPVKDEACVTVSIEPFAIEPCKAGEAIVYVTAKMKNNSLCQKWIKIIVNESDPQIDEPTNQPTPSDSGLELLCTKIISYSNLKEFDFFVVHKNDDTRAVILSLNAVVLQGSVVVDISRYTATLTFTSADTSCIIKFTAVTDSGNAEFLFVNSAS